MLRKAGLTSAQPAGCAGDDPGARYASQKIVAIQTKFVDGKFLFRELTAMRNDGVNAEAAIARLRDVDR